MQTGSIIADIVIDITNAITAYMNAVIRGEITNILKYSLIASEIILAIILIRRSLKRSHCLIAYLLSAALVGYYYAPQLNDWWNLMFNSAVNLTFTMLRVAVTIEILLPVFMGAGYRVGKNLLMGALLAAYGAGTYVWEYVMVIHILPNSGTAYRVHLRTVELVILVVVSIVVTIFCQKHSFDDVARDEKLRAMVWSLFLTSQCITSLVYSLDVLPALAHDRPESMILWYAIDHAEKLFRITLILSYAVTCLVMPDDYVLWLRSYTLRLRSWRSRGRRIA